MRYAGAALAASSAPRRFECCLQSRDHFRVKLAFATHSLLHCSKRPGLVIYRREMGSNRVSVLQVIDCGALCCMSLSPQPQQQGSRGAFLQSFLHRSGWRRRGCCLCCAIKEKYGLTLRRFEERRWRRTGLQQIRFNCPNYLYPSCGCYCFNCPLFQISSSSRLLHAVARLSAHFAAGEMPQLEQQQQQQQQPLCTHQYPSAFGTYRKPTLSQDTLIKTPSSCHALVISNGHMFSVPIKVRVSPERRAVT